LKLIKNIIKDDINIFFYKGIDFNMIINHPNDGSKGMIFFFVDNYINELKKYKRNCKISSVIDNFNFEDFNLNSLNKNYIVIYQIEDDSIINELINKFCNNINDTQLYIPVYGLKKGALRISGTDVIN
jgi:hypothetical protein